MSRWWVWGLVCALIGCSSPSPLPDMQPGEIGRVTKIIDGDGLILDTGQRVRLISITAPVLSPRVGEAEPFSGESARILEDLALGRRVQLFYPGLTRDRYDRALAHAVTVDGAGPPIWLNRAMIARGAARVRLYGSTSARGQDFLALEREARESGSGLWALAHYSVQDAADVDPGVRGFALVSGTLGPAISVDAETRFPPACERMFDGATLKLRIDRDAASACGLANGTRVDVRGWLSEGVLDLRHPWHLDVLPAPSQQYIAPHSPSSSHQ
ncbi:MAG: thermonuclease family protein [Pseudomonadota bacterium]